MNYPIGDMPLTLLTKITEQLPDNVCVVPFYRGEPLLYPQFSEAMQIISKFQEVQLATNGDYLTAKNQTAILRTCTFLSLSLHEFLMPWQTRWLGFLYDCLGKDIDTQVSILDSDVDELQRSRFVTEWSKHVNRVRVYETHSVGGFGSMVLKGKTIAPCHKPFEDMVVYWDGKVGLCNHDWNNLYSLGNLNVQSVEEVWNGKDYETVREFHKGGLRRAIPTCEHCSFESNKIYGELIVNGK